MHRALSVMDLIPTGKRKTVPTVLFADGSTLTNPSLAQVKAKVGA